MSGGKVVSGGSRRSRRASTMARSSSKNAGSFINWPDGRRWNRSALESLELLQEKKKSRLFFGCGLERLSVNFAIGSLQQYFDLSFGFLKLLLAFARQIDTFFE